MVRLMIVPCLFLLHISCFGQITSQYKCGDKEPIAIYHDQEKITVKLSSKELVVTTFFDDNSELKRVFTVYSTKTDDYGRITGKGLTVAGDHPYEFLKTPSKIIIKEFISDYCHEYHFVDYVEL